MSQARILAVDDQLYFRVFLEDLLSDSGYAVETAANGTDALDRLSEQSFDIVLSDLVMPGMDGSELVQRIKERWPELPIVVVTSVGDVKTAVDAMKLGATDYLLKPLDKVALLRSLEGILERLRIEREHRDLVAENLEYLSAFSQYERALSLFATMDLEVLADRIVEAFCLETNAHSGVVWLVRPDAPDELRLAGVGGLVRVEEEWQRLPVDSLPDELSPLSDPKQGAWLIESKEGQGPTALLLPLRLGGPLLGLLRVSDKLDGKSFGSSDLELVGRLGAYASQAVANALAFRALERRSFRDATTQAYTHAYFEDIVENEIQKAHRFGRHFSLVRVELDETNHLRDELSPGDRTRLLQELASALRDALRTTDLLAATAEGSFCALLPESDAIGAAVAKRRLSRALEDSAAYRALSEETRSAVLAASASFPVDGPSREALFAALDQGLERSRSSMIRALDLGSMSFRDLIGVLLGDAATVPARTAEQVTRFIFSELRRNLEQHAFLLIAPGEPLFGALRDSLAAIDARDSRTEIVLIADRRSDLQPALPVTWVSPMRTGTDCPFLVYYGEGISYAMIREPGNDPTVALYHTADPEIVEHLAFQLGRDLGILIGD